MTIAKIAFACVFTLALTGCNSIASSTNTLTDDQIKSQTSGALGYAPSDVSIVSRRTEGTNTYVAVKTNDSKQFNCIINGGNLLTFGMTNPPACAKKGEPIKAAPFGG
jgi:hypothetical protein